jgi:hypothetical protein
MQEKFCQWENYVSSTCHQRILCFDRPWRQSHFRPKGQPLKRPTIVISVLDAWLLLYFRVFLQLGALRIVTSKNGGSKNQNFIK